MKDDALKKNTKQTEENQNFNKQFCSSVKEPYVIWAHTPLLDLDSY